MTSVNVTTTKNTVTVNEGDSTVINVVTRGPAGPTFSSSGATSGTFKADATTTKLTLVDGGSF